MLSLVAVFGIVALLFVLVVSGVQLAGLLEDYAPPHGICRVDVDPGRQGG